MPRACASSRASSGSSYARESRRSQNDRRRPRPPPASRESSIAIWAVVRRTSGAPFGDASPNAERSRASRAAHRRRGSETRGCAHRPAVGAATPSSDSPSNVVGQQVADRRRDRLVLAGGEPEVLPLGILDQNAGVDGGRKVRGQRLSTAAGRGNASQRLGVTQQSIDPVAANPPGVGSSLVLVRARDPRYPRRACAALFVWFRLGRRITIYLLALQIVVGFVADRLGPACPRAALRAGRRRLGRLHGRELHGPPARCGQKRASADDPLEPAGATRGVPRRTRRRRRLAVRAARAPNSH